MSTDPLLLQDVAEHLGVSRWTAARLLGKAGIEIPSTGLPLPDYAAWIKAQAVTCEDEDGDMTAPPELYTFDDVAERYGLSLRSLKDHARERKFAHTRFGKGWYFTGAQLEAFFAAREVKSTEDVALERMRRNRDRRQQRRSTSKS